MNLLTRRRFAQPLAAALGLGPLFTRLFAGPPGTRPFPIGACDWSIGKTADVTGMDLAAELGLDGLQVSPGDAADDIKLRRPEERQKYLEARDRLGIEIASLGFGALNNVPFKSDPRTEGWVDGVIEACHALGRSVILLAFFGRNDLLGDAAGRAETVRKLRRLAPKAEKLGVTLGLETWLPAAELRAILDEVASPAVRVYYDVANAQQRGYDVPAEIRELGGKNLICEFHMKENGALLGQGKVDFPAVRRAMDDIGYRGWVQIEGAIPAGRSARESYPSNRDFLRKLLAVAPGAP